MAEASRIVNKPGTGWTTILNAVAQDGRLSLDTRGLFLLMKSFPPDWEFNVGGLATMGQCGRDKIRRMLGELEKSGYLLREQSHDGGGKFAGNTYVLQDHPPGFEEAEAGTVAGFSDNGKDRCRISRQREKLSTENPTLTKEDNITNTPLPPNGGRRRRIAKSVPEWQAERFERFWSAYPRDEDRAKAVEQWDALPRDRELMERHGGDADRLLNEIARGLQRHLTCEDWQNNVGVPYAFRWLRDRRWTEKQRTGSTAATPPVLTRVTRTITVNGEEVVVFES